MRYDDQDRESKNVEDRRGEEGPSGFPGMRGGIQIPMGGGGMSFTTLLILGALMLLFGINPLDLLRGAGGGGPGGVPQLPRSEPGPRPQSTSTQRSPFDLPGAGRGQAQGPSTEDEMKKFISRVLADTEDVWGGRSRASAGPTKIRSW